MVQGFNRVRTDQYARSLALWHVFFFVPVVVFVPIGGGFAFQGKASYSQEPYRFFLDYFPHSLRVHGWILLALGMWLFAAQAVLVFGNVMRGWLLARIGLIGAGVYSTWSFIAFLGATWLNHKYTAGMFWYLAMLIVCGGLAMLAPPFNKARLPSDAVT